MPTPGRQPPAPGGSVRGEPPRRPGADTAPPTVPPRRRPGPVPAGTLVGGSSHPSPQDVAPTAPLQLSRSSPSPPARLRRPAAPPRSSQSRCPPGPSWPCARRGGRRPQYGLAEGARYQPACGRGCTGLAVGTPGVAGVLKRLEAGYAGVGEDTRLVITGMGRVDSWGWYCNCVPDQLTRSGWSRRHAQARQEASQKCRPDWLPTGNGSLHASQFLRPIPPSYSASTRQWQVPDPQAFVTCERFPHHDQRTFAISDRCMHHGPCPRTGRPQTFVTCEPISGVTPSRWTVAGPATHPVQRNRHGPRPIVPPRLSPSPAACRTGKAATARRQGQC